jgi:hypothetical protein
MIHYQLRCQDDHAFDGWFRDSNAFDTQAKGGLLTCPVCGGSDVSRALMAPAVGKKGNALVAAPAAPPATEAAAPPPPSQAVVAAMPDAMRALLQRMRAEVEKQCDYVGSDFADEARKIHNGESKARGIYGETTPEEAERLADDGIEVARIPWVPRADG